MTIDDDGRGRIAAIQQQPVDRAETQPQRNAWRATATRTHAASAAASARRAQPTARIALPLDLHRSAVAVRPKTSGSYISSACAGAVRNVPAVVARTMYDEDVRGLRSSRVAKSWTRSSWRST